MKRRPVTARQVQAALSMYAAAAPARSARVWRVFWLRTEPTIRRYQEPVTLARVLSEHHAAVAAEPLEN